MELASVVEWGRADAFEGCVHFLRFYVGSVAVIDDFCNMLLLLLPPSISLACGNTNRISTLREAGISIVLTKKNTVLSA